MQIIQGDVEEQLVTLFDSCDTFCDEDQSGPFGRRIEYVLHTEDMHPIASWIIPDRVDGLLPSDHYPVMSDLEFTEATIGEAPTQSRRTPLSTYNVFDLDRGDGFDGAGDRSVNVISRDTVDLNARDGASSDLLGNLFMSFNLPENTTFTPEIARATLRIHIDSINGNPTAPLGLWHSLNDNALVHEASDLQDPDYVMVQVEFVSPSSDSGRFYEMDVTDLVRGDMANDGLGPITSFRLGFPTDTPAGDFAYIVTLPTAGENSPELLLTYVPEPAANVVILVSAWLISGTRLVHEGPRKRSSQLPQ